MQRNECVHRELCYTGWQSLGQMMAHLWETIKDGQQVGEMLLNQLPIAVIGPENIFPVGMILLPRLGPGSKIFWNLIRLP